MQKYQHRAFLIVGRVGKIVPVLVLAAAGSQSLAQALPPVPFPAENPFSQEKADLGKILFWDEQISSDNTMSCGSCHQPAAGGTDGRRGTNPGLDALFGTADDVIGSPGVVTQTVDDEYFDSALYALLPQVTGRQAPPAVMAMYADELFWDGRAGSSFTDPITGELLIVSGGALESQAVGPPASDAEMAHAGRDWLQIVTKLVGARPLALASNLPADMDAVIATGMTYPELFEQAFGDPEITAGRVAMAIATYERTLVPDQSPYDLYVAGDTEALTPFQVSGLNSYRASMCNVCHIGAQFTNNGFQNIGVRPMMEDFGRFDVTGDNADRGRFKAPSLRNTGLRDRYMHNGRFETLEEVFDFYAHRNGLVPFPGNLDPFFSFPISFSLGTQNNIISFLRDGLTDPRVAAETFPFDRPTLYAELAIPNPMLVGSGTAGTDGAVPAMLAVTPPNLGNDGFKLGVNGALGGATAWVAVSTSAPVGGLVPQDTLLGPITLNGVGGGNGFGTMPWPIPNDPSMDGDVWYMQWLVSDPNAAGGTAVSEVAKVTLFCTQTGVCVNTCPGDLTGDGTLDISDVFAFLSAYNNSDLAADLTGDGTLDISDVFAFLSAYNAGCP